MTTPREVRGIADAILRRAAEGDLGAVIMKRAATGDEFALRILADATRAAEIQKTQAIFNEWDRLPEQITPDQYDMLPQRLKDAYPAPTAEKAAVPAPQVIEVEVPGYGDSIMELAKSVAALAAREIPAPVVINQVRPPKTPKATSKRTVISARDEQGRPSVIDTVES